MEIARKPFQGIMNIVSFNRHFYIMAAILIVVLASLQMIVDGNAALYLSVAIGMMVLWSLAISAYVYDFSGLYDFSSIKSNQDENLVINITAGFDETSGILKSRFPHSDFQAFNFYDPAKHTEISIERAVKKYAAYPGTLNVDTAQLPASDRSVDKIFVNLPRTRYGIIPSASVFFVN